MVKVKDEPAMAEPNSATSPKPSNNTTNNDNNVPSSYAVRKPRPHTHSHHHHHPPFQHYTFYHQCNYPTESGDAVNGASSPATFYFGPGFEPQQQVAGSTGYAPGPSQNQGNEYVVFFHVNPGVTISFQMGDSWEILRGNLNFYLLKLQFFTLKLVILH